MGDLRTLDAQRADQPQIPGGTIEPLRPGRKVGRPTKEVLERLGERLGRTFGDYATLHNLDRIIEAIWEPRREHFPSEEAYQYYLQTKKLSPKAGLPGYDEEGRALSENLAEKAASLVGGAAGLMGPFGIARAAVGAPAQIAARKLLTPKALATGAEKVSKIAATARKAAELAAAGGATFGAYSLAETLVDPRFEQMTPAQKAGHVAIGTSLGAVLEPVIAIGGPKAVGEIASRIRGDKFAPPEVRLAKEALKPEYARPLQVTNPDGSVSEVPMWKFGDYVVVRGMTGDKTYSVYRATEPGQDALLIRSGIKNEGQVIAAVRDSWKREVAWAEQVTKAEAGRAETGAPKPAEPKIEVLPGRHQRGQTVNVVDAEGNLVTPQPVKVTDVRYQDGVEYVQAQGSKTYFPASQIEVPGATVERPTQAVVPPVTPEPAGVAPISGVAGEVKKTSQFRRAEDLAKPEAFLRVMQDLSRETGKPLAEFAKVTEAHKRLQDAVRKGDMARAQREHEKFWNAVEAVRTAPVSQIEAPGAQVERPTQAIVPPVEPEPVVAPEVAQKAVEATTAGRRKDFALRTEIDKLSPEEKDEVIKDLREHYFKDELTGLKNRAAYLMDEKQPFQAVLDLDNLKWVNDNIGHGAGDTLIKALAKELPDNAYHLSGDEFIIQGGSEEELKALLSGIESRLSEQATQLAGDKRTVVKRGIGFGYGIGETLEKAETALQQHKKARLEEGKRVARGETPAGIVDAKAEAPVKTQPPAAEKPAVDAKLQNWDAMSEAERFELARSAGWASRTAAKMSRQKWSELSPAAQNVQRIQPRAPETPAAKPEVAAREPKTFTGWYTPVSKGGEQIALHQSSGLPMGQFIALDKPFQSEVHDASKARQVTVDVENVYDPDGVLSPANAKEHKAIWQEMKDYLRQEAGPVSAVESIDKISDLLVRFRQLMTDFLQSKGFDAYVRGIDGDVKNRELIVFDRSKVKPDLAKPPVEAKAPTKKPWQMTLLEYAKNELIRGNRPGVAAQLTSEDQAKSYRAQYIKELLYWWREDKALIGADIKKYLRESPLFEREYALMSLMDEKVEVGPEPEPAMPEVLAIRARIGEIHTKLSDAKVFNPVHAEKYLRELEQAGVEIDDALELLQEYRDIVRKDYEDAEEYQGARTEAKEAFLDAVSGLDVSEVGVAAPAEPAKPTLTGKTATVKTERGTAVETQYAVVEAENLITSHDTALKVNPDYPKELQPRDRARPASQDQINRMIARLEPEFLGEGPKASEGAPIVGLDMVVESGNARIIALKGVYDQKHDNAAKYREWLKANAQRFGLKSEDLENVKNPVLVRVRQSDIDRVQFVREANEQAVAAMSASEQAFADADKITGSILDLFVPHEEGNVVHRGNWDFIRSFMDQVVGPAERGRYLTADGGISQEGAARIRNAVFARAYGDPAALAKLAESTDSNIRNITNAMLMSAPRLAKLREGIKKGELYDLDLTGDIAAAANKLSTLREQGMTVERYLAQGALFGDELSPLAKDILQVFDEHKRSGKKLASFLLAYAERVETMGDPRQTTLFETRPVPTKAEVLDAVIERVNMHGEALQSALFEDAAPPSEVARKPAVERRAESARPEGPAAAALKTADDIEAALKADFNRITVGVDISAPRPLMDQLAARVRGWDAARNEDGSVTFSRPPDKATVREVQEAYGRLEQRDPSFKEEATKMAQEAVTETFSKRDLSTTGGILHRVRSGVRTIAVGIRRDLIQNGQTSLIGHQVETADELAVLAQILRDPRYETLRVFYVDKEGKILAHEAIKSGLPNAVHIGGRVGTMPKWIWKINDRIRRLKADGFYLLHNHPSGNPEPSFADQALTTRVGQSCSQKLKGHVIIDLNKYAVIDPSFADRGALERRGIRVYGYEVKGLSTEKRDLLLSPEVPHNALGELITSPDHLAFVGAMLPRRDGFVNLVYLSAKSKVRAIQEMPVNLFKREQEAADFMRGQARTFGALSVVAYYDGFGAGEVHRAAEKHVKNGTLLDMVFPQGVWPPVSVRQDATPPPGDWFVGRKVPRGAVRVREGEQEYEGIDYLLKRTEVVPTKKPEKAKRPSAAYGSPAEAAQPTVAVAREIPSVAREDIIRFIEQKFQVPVRRGRFRQQAVGIYKWKPEVIRIKGRFLFIHVHELGHHLDKRLGLSENRAFDDELHTLGRTLYPDMEDPKKLRREGIAEFMKYFVANEATAQMAAPRYYAEFQAILGSNPDLAEAVKELRGLYQAYMNLDPVRHMDTMLAPRGATVVQRLRQAVRWSSIYTRTVDEFDVLRRTEDAILAGAERPDTGLLADVPRETIRRGEALRKEVPMSKSVFARRWRGRGQEGRAARWLFGDGRDKVPGGDPVGPSLTQILKPVHPRMDDFRRYIMALKADNAHKHNIETGYDPEKAKEAIAALESPVFRKAAEELVAFRRAVRDQLVAKDGKSAGFLYKVTKDGKLIDQAKAMDEKWEWPFPFYREFGTEGQAAPDRIVNLGQPIKRMKGSERPIIDPIVGIVRDTVQMLKLAEMNQVAVNLDQIAQATEGMGWLVEKVPAPLEATQFKLDEIKQFLDPETAELIDEETVAVIFRPRRQPGAKEAAENIATIWIGGKPTFRQFSPDVYDALFKVGPEFGRHAEWIIKTLSFPARILRTSVTLGLEFMGRNVMRDTQEVWIYSKAGVTPKDTLVAGMEILAAAIRGGKPKDYWRMASAGGFFRAAVVSMDRDYIGRSLEEVLGGKVAMRQKIGEIFFRPHRIPVHIFHGLEKWSEYFENINRYAEMKKVAEKTGWDPDGAMEVGLAGRDVTIDFARVGSRTEALRQVEAFWNATVQGWDKFFREHRDNPVRTMFRAFLYVTLPTILLYLINRDDPHYQELPRWRKDLFYNIPTGTYVNGKHFYMPIPRVFAPMGLVYGMLPQRMLEYLDTHDKRAFEEVKDRFLKEVPIPRPTALTAIFAVWSNKGWWGGPIVPREEERLLPEEQYDIRTSEVAKWIGKAFGTSPRKVDYAIRASTGYLGGYTTWTLDQIAIVAGVRKEPPAGVENVPVIRAFLVSAPGPSAASISRFYEERTEVDREYSTIKRRAERGEYGGLSAEKKLEILQQAVRLAAKRKDMNKVADVLGDLRKTRQELQEGKTADVRDLTPEQRKALMDALDLMRTNVVRFYYEEEPLPVDLQQLNRLFEEEKK